MDEIEKQFTFNSTSHAGAVKICKKIHVLEKGVAEYYFFGREKIQSRRAKLLQLLLARSNQTKCGAIEAKFRRSSVMVWGAFCYDSKRNLVPITCRMTSTAYTYLLQQNLILHSL
ncbi:unnamed protein product [Ceratitis capitata]|uniref:(Mediterranean fruit fly) hypothetical protein n=1 Tax=Ceratitis capitata TaxID=7213 RepID=A0A811UX07_CERCA|nr:unnamed protein product [Ceratitis capitata]